MNAPNTASKALPSSSPVQVFFVSIPNDPAPARVVITQNEGEATVEASISHPRYKGAPLHRSMNRGQLYGVIFNALVASFGEFGLQVTPEGSPTAMELLARAETAASEVFIANAKTLARVALAFARNPRSLYDAGKGWAKACTSYKPEDAAKYDMHAAAAEKDAMELQALCLQVNPEAAQGAPRLRK